MSRRKKNKQPSVNYLELPEKAWSSMDWSAFKDKLTIGHRLPKAHQRALMVMVPALLLLILFPFPEPGDISVEPKRVEVDINTTGLSMQENARQNPLVSKEWQQYEVKNGDTLAQVFRSNNLAMSDLNALVKVEGSDKPLSYIKQGQLVRFKLTEEGQLDILQLEKNNHSVMFFRLSDGGFGRSK